MLATPAKAAAIAKEFMQLHGRALKFTTGGVRSALVCELVLAVVTAQEETCVIKSGDVYELRQMAEAKITEKLGAGFFE